MALYSKEQLAYERSIGLELSDYDNEHFYDPTSPLEEWSNVKFEQWLSSKKWSSEIKDAHRGKFKGFISFNGNGAFSYE